MICVPVTLTGVDVKQKAIAEFQSKRQLIVSSASSSSSAPPTMTLGHHCHHHQQQQQPQQQSGSDERNDCDKLNLVQLSRMYKLTRISKLHDDFDEGLSLSRANIQNNEEMLLVSCANANSNAITSTDKALSNTSTSTSTGTGTNGSIEMSLVTNTKDSVQQPNDYDSSGELGDDDELIVNSLPTQQQIDLATANIEKHHLNGPNVVNIDELVLQSDVQYDIRKILISLANHCAYVIGAGPYAPRIIMMLKQRLIQRKRHEHDTQQCLISMGFSRPKVQYALHMNK